MKLHTPEEIDGMSGSDTPPAMHDILARYGKMVSSISRRMIRDEETARDAAQEVWLEIVRNLNSFRGESKVSTWIYAIATRVILNYAKKERIHSTKFLKDFFHGEERQYPEDADVDKEVWVRQMCDQCLTGILHCLDNEARIAYILREMTEVSYGDIARILDKDEAAVRKIISRSRRKLKNFLEDECILFNRRGGCRCRMRKLVEEINLTAEYEKLRRTVHRVNLYRESETVLPKKNYWEALL